MAKNAIPGAKKTRPGTESTPLLHEQR
jgi:hypothetical protein